MIKAFCCDFPLSNVNFLTICHFSSQLLDIALMGAFVWLMDLWGLLAEWRSASMECGEQCVQIAGITMMPELCADNWGTVSTQVKVRSLF